MLHVAPDVHPEHVVVNNVQVLRDDRYRVCFC